MTIATLIAQLAAIAVSAVMAASLWVGSAAETDPEENAAQAEAVAAICLFTIL